MAALSAKEREFWRILNTFIRERGGWIVSEHETAQIRMECPQGSKLPEMLSLAGHNPRHMGTNERIVMKLETVKRGGSDTTVSHHTPGTVDVYEFSIPSLDSREPKGRLYIQ